MFYGYLFLEKKRTKGLAELKLINNTWNNNNENKDAVMQGKRRCKLEAAEYITIQAICVASVPVCLCVCVARTTRLI